MSSAQQVEMLSKIQLGSVFIIDPTLLPKGPGKPTEEEFTDCKIHFFYPSSMDIHEQRKQAGISEGIVSFFKPFSEVEAPIECIATSTHTHVVSQVEQNIWLNIVIQHPESLYGVENRSGQESESGNAGETIANSRFQYSTFREEDSRILFQVLKQYYAFLVLFHGKLRQTIDRHVKNESMNLFRDQLTDFTRNFSKYFFVKDFTSNFFWNLSYQGFFYCPIDKKSFLQAQFVQNAILMDFEDQVEHCAIFHENYFICSSLPHLNMQVLYSYLVGVQTSASSGQSQASGAANLTASQRDQAGFTTALANLIKVTSFKNTAQLTRVSANQASRAERLSQKEESKVAMQNLQAPEEAKVEADAPSGEETKEDFVIVDNSYLDTVSESHNLSNLSDFTRVNPLTAQADFKHLTAMPTGFVIGPQLRPFASRAQSARGAANASALAQSAAQQEEFIDIFAPIIYLKTSESETDTELQPFRMFVFLGFKTMTVLLFKVDFDFTHAFLTSLNAHLSRQVPILSQLLDQIVNRPQPVQQDDPLRFFYFSRMNLAIKLSNLQSKEVFSNDLKLILCQLHQKFEEDPDCLEQQMNTSYFWVVGINSLGREIYFIFPPNYSNAKVEQEKNKIMQTYFASLFI